MPSSTSADTTDSAEYTPETEEQLQMRLVQLLRLPPPSQDTCWTPREVEGEREEAGGSALSLDIMQLAESLSTLPTHTRLALPVELLQHYGVSESDLVLNEASDGSSSGEPSAAGEQSSTANTAGASVAVKALLSKSDYTFNFSAPSKQDPPTMPLVQDRTNLSTDNDQGLDSLLQASSHGHKASPHTKTHPPTPHGHKAPPHTSTHLPSPQSHPSHTSTATGKAATHPSLNTATKQMLPTTAELDDMLDDLLA